MSGTTLGKDPGEVVWGEGRSGRCHGQRRGQEPGSQSSDCECLSCLILFEPSSWSLNGDGTYYLPHPVIARMECGSMCTDHRMGWMAGAGHAIY